MQSKMILSSEITNVEDKNFILETIDNISGVSVMLQNLIWNGLYTKITDGGYVE